MKAPPLWELIGEPAGGAPLLATLKVMKGDEDGQLPTWGLRQHGVGSSTGDFGRWRKVALRVGRLPL
jgi:hypothetical protein